MREDSALGMCIRRRKLYVWKEEILGRCMERRNPWKLKLHAQMAKRSFFQGKGNVVSGGKLTSIKNYANVRAASSSNSSLEAEAAAEVWDNLSEAGGRGKVLSWNANANPRIMRHARAGQCETEAVRAYERMRKAGLRLGLHLDAYTFPSLLKACATQRALEEGKQIHASIIITGFHSYPVVANSLIHVYAKCGAVHNARQVFDKMCQRDLVSFNSMIACYNQNDHWEKALAFYAQMELAGIKSNSVTLASVIPAYARLANLRQCKEIHGSIIRREFESDLFVSSALVDMYSKCSSIENARKVFDKMPQRNAVSWNTMIAGYAHAENVHGIESLNLFIQMQLENIKPSSFTLLGVLSSCAHLVAIKQGEQIHAYIIRNGFESVVFVANALVEMYAKFGRVGEAQRVFDGTLQRDIVTWSTMIAGYAHKGYSYEALKLFQQLAFTDIKPNPVTVVSILPACASLEALQQGMQIHGYIIRNGFEFNITVGNALIDMYAKCKNIEIARLLFIKMPQANVVSWNAMIAGYSQNGNNDEALKLFHRMQAAGMEPNLLTIASVISACARLGALQQGKEIHDYLSRSKIELDAFAWNALIDMYAKCGSIDIAQHMFDRMPKRDVVSWTVMIDGYGMNGHGEDAITLFSQMQVAGMKPDYVTFVALLSACSHAGLVNEGWHCFNCMRQDYCITPGLDHYACMVDLLGRAGQLDDAYAFIKKIPLKSDAGVWGALLSACRIHCHIELGELAAKELFELEPENAGYYVLLSNIYATAGRWDDVGKVRIMMEERGLKKNPGCTWVEVDSKVHTFYAGDRSHPQSEKIYAMLEILARQIEGAGYVPDTSFVLHDVDEEDKEYLLCGHSERLAIAFGLINTCTGTTIRIVKNLRVCGDCHIATKFISMVAEREIVVRDANRFHHFKDGVCSCGDYW